MLNIKAEPLFGRMKAKTKDGFLANSFGTGQIIISPLNPLARKQFFMEQTPLKYQSEMSVLMVLQ